VTFPPTAGCEAILSGNIYQKAVVLGAVDLCRAGATLTGLAATVSINGASVELPDDLEANTGPILDVVAVVADTLAAMGERLNAGELIIAGSIVPPLFPQAGTTISYSLGEAQPLSIRIV
jgi:2-keto-4-pentenoate hydratase